MSHTTPRELRPARRVRTGLYRSTPTSFQLPPERRKNTSTGFDHGACGGSIARIEALTKSPETFEGAGARSSCDVAGEPIGVDSPVPLLNDDHVIS